MSGDLGIISDNSGLASYCNIGIKIRLSLQCSQFF